MLVLEDITLQYLFFVGYPSIYKKWAIDRYGIKIISECISSLVELRSKSLHLFEVELVLQQHVIIHWKSPASSE